MIVVAELRKDSEERHEIARQLFPEGHLLHDILKDILS